MVRIIVTSIELRWKTMLFANESQCQNLKHWFKIPDINNDFFGLHRDIGFRLPTHGSLKTHAMGGGV